MEWDFIGGARWRGLNFGLKGSKARVFHWALSQKGTAMGVNLGSKVGCRCLGSDMGFQGKRTLLGSQDERVSWGSKVKELNRGSKVEEFY